MQTYMRQGGKPAIFICNDGLQLISAEERKEHIVLYANHNIGWVACPGHSSALDSFKRVGRFKKASNMNSGLGVSCMLNKSTWILMYLWVLALSLRLEKFLAELEASGEEDGPGDQCLEDKAMCLAEEEIFEESGKQFRPWCQNGKIIRVGQIILIIDSDTIVPEVGFFSFFVCLFGVWTDEVFV